MAIAGNYRRALQRMEIGRPLPQATYLRDLLSSAVGAPDSSFSRAAGTTLSPAYSLDAEPPRFDMDATQPLATDSSPQSGGGLVAPDYNLTGAPGFATTSGAIKPVAVGTKPRRRRGYSAY